jgi:EAL domain-containing protein (putative c-di-GMP-specific phosphodiesterase class I)
MSSAILASVESDWYLTGCVAPGEPARRLPIHSSPFQIGRRPGVGLQLASPRVSKLHAEIVIRGEQVVLRDMGSTNGTFVNGSRVYEDAPIHEGDLLQFADTELRIERRPADRGMQTVESQSFEWLWTLTQFDKLMDEGGIIPHFQPIIAVEENATVGYEVLARSRVAGLENPKLMFEVAEQLERACELSELCRCEGLSAAQALPGYPVIFLNTHPHEDLRELVGAMRLLRAKYPEQPIAVEIHEASVTDTKLMREVRGALKDLDVELAYDDFGAGQSRLVDLIEVPPDYLKFDMSLIRDVHKASAHQHQMLSTLVRMVREVGIVALAEGVERREEIATCQQLGFNYAQGYFFGKPAPIDQVLTDVLAARAPAAEPKNVVA